MSPRTLYPNIWGAAQRQMRPTRAPLLRLSVDQFLFLLK